MCILPDGGNGRHRGGRPQYRPKQPGWGSPGWPPSKRKRFSTLGEGELAMCLPQQEGQRQSKRGTKRWYDQQRKKGGWFSREAWFHALREDGLRAWFRWVFLRLDEHETSCRWRRLAGAVTGTGR